MRKRGYTLIELMTVVAILSAIAGMTAAAMGPMVRRLRVTQAAAVATGALAQARAQARASLRCVEVDVTTPVAGRPPDALVPSPPGEAGTLLRLWRWNDLTCAGGHAQASLLETFPLPATVGLAMPSSITFLGNGRVAAPLSAQVSALDGQGSIDLVRVTAPGIICSFTGGAGACP